MNRDPQELLVALDELLARSPVERLPALLAALHARAGVALARLDETTWEGVQSSGKTAPNENLPVKEAARRLGVSPAWIYRHARKLPFTVRIGRRLLILRIRAGAVHSPEAWTVRYLDI